jgi:signal transduction histidine kinase
MKPKIKYKIILLFTVFTFLLLTAIFLYFYISNKEYIREQSKANIEFYSVLFIETLQKELTNTYLELDGLRDQLKNYAEVIKPGATTESDFSRTLNTYLLIYPYRFLDIYIRYNKWLKVLKVSPTRSFNGDLTLTENWIDTLKTPALISYKDNKKKSGQNHYEYWKDEITLNLPASAGKPIELFVILKLDYLIEESMSKINFPGTISLSLVNMDSVVVFSTLKKNTNQHINIVLPFAKTPSSNPEETQQPFSINNTMMRWYKIQQLDYKIFIQDNYSQSIESLNSVAIRILIFSVLIMMLVLIVTIFFSNRLSITLNRLTKVANQVAKGDFSKKIELRRNDEIGILIDSFNDMVTKLDQNYRELNNLNKQLETKIHELIQTKSELSQKQRLALVGETISKISHEIQNKISGISIWTQNLEFQLKNDETAKIYLGEIKEALRSFQDKLVNFKKFYRQPQLNIQKIEINPFIENIINNYLLEINSKELVVKKTFGSNLPSFCGDKEQMEEAFINLLINALYYSPQKGVMEVKSFLSGDKICISISDEGPGIKHEDLDKIVQPFYTTKQSGSGLGLAIVNNIVSAHKGKLKYFNKENGGTCFEIILPLNDNGVQDEDSFS